MRIHKNTAKALLVTIGRDTSHDRLKVEQTGEAISTNGHVLLKAPPAPPDSDAKDQQPVEAIIPGPVIETAIKAIKGRQDLRGWCDHVAIEPSGDGVSVTSTDSNGPVCRATVETTGDVYPDWKNVLDQQPATLRVTIAADVLTQLVKAAKAVKHTTPSVTLTFHQDDLDGSEAYSQVIGVEIPSDHTAPILGAAMPMRA